MEGYIISFSPEARTEALKAYLWYQGEQPGLEKKFRGILRIKIESINQNPKASSFVYKNIRSARMRIFPYNVIYRISNLNIQIIAIFHH
ncbi:MAG TPA: type II toxin-antitoxin system RelE/ParE family toxin [Hanamia sp.]|nr:type II toxin-antitoxin system RelE/ParE family toxin [Hanamia sp.]